MRVKVGDQWFEAKPGQPIMVEIDSRDRANLATFPPDRDRYVVFAENNRPSEEDILAWVNEGAKRQTADTKILSKSAGPAWRVVVKMDKAEDQ